MTPQRARQSIPIGVLILAPLAVLSAAGGLPLDQLNAAAAHHVFHFLIPALAFAVFAVCVALEISKRGWPTFSWRLSA
jgi:hypothetical protein